MTCEDLADYANTTPPQQVEAIRQCWEAYLMDRHRTAHEIFCGQVGLILGLPPREVVA